MIQLDTERQNLILHLLNRVPAIESYSKFYNLIYLLKKETGDAIFPDYKFDRDFLTIRDSLFDRDLSTLVLQRFVDNDKKPIDSSHTHEIKIRKEGISRLKALEIEAKLKSKFGKETLRRLEKTIIEYNNLDTRALVDKTRRS